ncbi:MAG: acyltransferase [Nanoarchaeota archaeon]|nr:acyltransferase [Nanoarchaeota archaeon]
MDASPGRMLIYLCYYLLYGVVKYLPTPLGEPLRFAVLKLFLRRLGNSSMRIRDGVTIHYPERVSIGEHVTLNEWVNIDGMGGVTIGDWTRVGHRVSLLSADHGFAKKDIVTAKQKMSASPIVIGENVLINAGAMILRGVKIGSGSVIGAGSLVIRDVPEHVVVMGVPAKIVKRR